MSTEQMRSEFEQWFKKEIIDTDDFEFLSFDESENEYQVTEDDNVDLYLSIQSMYMAWQASRAALVVELPETTDVVDWCFSADVFEATKVFECLRAAGITVKEG